MKKLTNILICVLLITTNCAPSKKFKWTSNEDSKLIEIGLTKKEVIVLASLVEKETDLADEKPKIARVFLNRLQKDMYLQSDATVKYANGDVTLKRISTKHIEIDSPYNTYKNKGLPPNPICEPSKETILAVLNADKNNYLFFCLAPDFSGHFNYAETYKEQIENGKLYLEALNKRH